MDFFWIVSFLGLGLNSSIHGTHGPAKHQYSYLPQLYSKHLLTIICFKFSMALQIGEANLVGSFLGLSLLTLHLLFRIFIHMFSLLEFRSNHPSQLYCQSIIGNFAFFFFFLKPRPPFFLGRHSLSQGFQARYCPFPFFEFHQNLLVMLSSLSQIVEVPQRKTLYRMEENEPQILS